MRFSKNKNMVSGACTAALAATLIAAGSVGALAQGAPTPAQLMDMIAAQQQQLNAMKAQLEKAQAQAQQAAAQAETAAKPGFLDSIQVGGVIEVEATNTGTYANADSSDLALSKVELFLDTKPHEYLSTHVQLLYEDGSDNITLDEAFATLGNTEKFPMYLQAGRWAMPFGGFDTDMSTDPLTKTLGETKESSVLVGVAYEGFVAEGYLYNGDTQQAGEGDHIDQFGLNLGYEGETQGVAYAFGGGYISNIADSDGLTDKMTTATAIDDYVGGGELHASVGFSGVTLRAGYMTALDDFNSADFAFNGKDASPAAWNLEAAYTTPIMGRDVTFAATYQGSDEALALELPETRIGAAVTVNVMEHAAVTAEYIHDDDYGTSDGGTGNDAHTATVKLAVDF